MRSKSPKPAGVFWSLVPISTVGSALRFSKLRPRYSSISMTPRMKSVRLRVKRVRDVSVASDSGSEATLAVVGGLETNGTYTP